MIAELFTDGVLRERRDDTSRTVTTYDETGTLIENNAITALRRVCGHPAGSRLQGRRLRSVARYLPGRYRHRQRSGWTYGITG